MFSSRRYKVGLSQKKEKLYASSIMSHEAKWKPSRYQKGGREGMFHPVHAYVENPPAERTAVKGVKAEREGFRGMGPLVLSTPSPSISLNRVNMAKVINRSLSPKR